jgi:extracellular elastinolytic metalloproteinase
MTPSLPHRTTPWGTRRAHLALATATALLTLVPGLTQLPALAQSPAAAPPAQVDADEVVTWGDSVPGLSDLDTRGVRHPTTSQRSAAAALGAVDLGWNRFGTPSSILPDDGVLAEATSDDPVAAARAWLRGNAAAFGLTTAQVDGLELVNDQRFAQSNAHAVLFRQRFGTLTPALGGMVTVGVGNGEIAFASSSIAPTSAAPAAASLTPLQGWLSAARNVGRTNLDVDAITSTVDRAAEGWTRLAVPGFAQDQLVRLRALPLADGTVRPVFEANVVDVDQGVSFAYTLMVDAVTGDVLHRQNQVEHSQATEPFQGSIDGTACGEPHPFELTDGNTRQVTVVMSAVNVANDAVVKLLDPQGDVITSADLLTSPETLSYTSPGPLPQGIYSVQICPFDGAAWLPPTNYAGLVTTSDSEGGSSPVGYPAWRYFPANPSLNWSPDHTPTNNEVGCWRVDGREYCSLSTGSVAQIYSAPWDYSHELDAPTLTTVGNNASTHEAWASPLTPGGAFQAPVSPTREYLDEFGDAWNNSKCDPAQLVPGGNDIFASVTNLFVAHNRMHDYSYALGFTERNYNLQQVNVENPDPGRDADPELGNAQAGALSGGQPSFLGRDNANQITLQDGVPGITNQYLFQPIAGAFYSPCADGGLDMSIVGHEYTHAISNRMIGGPDEGITSEQGGAMGESWGDLVGAEYLFSHGYPTGTNPWAVGPYATGNQVKGIRDYAINRNPLTYANYGFDSTGPEVHADGEIWNGVMWELRSALVDRWNARYPYSHRQRQLRCAEGNDRNGPLRPRLCPGNRRWVALMFDAFLLQQGATSFVDARNAMIAADRLRFGGANRKVLWDAFAKRGLGNGAHTTPDSTDPTAAFTSPTARNATVRFDTPGPGKVYVGRYEARSNPVADTLRRTAVDGTAAFVPGRYEMLFVSAKRGFKRFSLTVAPGDVRTVRISQPRNLASAAVGARVIGASEGSLNAGSLIDGTESTNWGGVNADGTNVDETSPFVSVDLAGRTHPVTRVNVSAMLTPAPAEETEVPLAQDPDSGSRFTALRRFALERCVSDCRSQDATWKRFYVSRADAFPSIAPRPVAPDLIMRSFDVPDVRAAAIRLVALENQCTGYAGYAGDQDNDPLNNPDCKTGSDRGSIVHAAELQVF